MEYRVSRLECEVESLRASVADIRSLRRETDAASVELRKRIDRLEAQLDALRVARLNTWILGIAFAVTAALFGTLAHGFGWL